MRLTTALTTLALSLPASAANIYILSSGDAATDNAVVAALTSGGHTCTVGPQFFQFTGSESLADIQTVYLQDNFNWAHGSMPASGQQALIAWVQSGGRLVTCEWSTYYSTSTLSYLGPIMPLAFSYTYGGQASTTYDQGTPDAAVDAGVPASLTFALTNFGGTEVYTTAKPSATPYFTSRGHTGAVGLAGWVRGSGSVFSFSTTCGPAQLADANFARLFSNVMGATAIYSCYPNCDGSTAAPVLNVADFSCFLQKYAAGDASANCDQSTSTPILNVADFTCFLQQYAEGCP